jgi:hypothetical protein
MSICARPGCFNTGINGCSVCLREPYCGGDCQKADWKSHKLICKTLKKLSQKNQPYEEVVGVIEEILKDVTLKISMELDVRLLAHLKSYAKHQAGDRVLLGNASRKRNINYLVVEMLILIPDYIRLVDIYQKDDSLCNVILRDDLVFQYYENMLHVLRPWPESCKEKILRNQINFILILLSRTERNIASIHILLNEFNLAEDHCQRALSYAKLHEGTEEEISDLLM